MLFHEVRLDLSCGQYRLAKECVDIAAKVNAWKRPFINNNVMLVAASADLFLGINQLTAPDGQIQRQMFPQKLPDKQLSGVTFMQAVSGDRLDIGQCLQQGLAVLKM